MKKKRIFSFLLVLSALAFYTVEAQVKFYIRCNEQQININSLLSVDYIIDNASTINDLVIPDFKNFTVLSGPNPSNTSSTLNGKSNSSYIVSYLLRPKLTGNLRLPAATARINNTNMQTAAFNIKVAGEKGISAEAQTISENEYILNPGESIAEKIKQNMMVLLQVNKTVCVEGEPIIATYKLCTRLKSESRISKRPALNGFSVYDMLPSEGNMPTVETINGKSFQVHIIRKIQLYALQPGIFELDEVILDNTVHLLKRKTSSKEQNNPAPGMQEEEWLNEKISLSSKPITITVKALPPVSNALFSGAVGTFQISSSLLNNKTVTTGEVVPFQVTITGDGNLPLLSVPALDLPKGLNSTTPLVKEELDKTVAPVKGRKIFTYDLVAEASGTYELPGVKYTYFDPLKAAYITTSAKPVVLNVVPLSVKPSPKKQTATVVSTTHTPILPTFVWVSGLCILALGILLYFNKKTHFLKKQSKENTLAATNEIPNRNTAAARDYFYAATNALEVQNFALFYVELNKGIWSALGDLLQQPPGILNKNNVAALLKAKGVSATMIDSLVQLLQQSEIALYSPSGINTDPSVLLTKGSSMIAALFQLK